VQARGFLRAYADFLGLDADSLLASLGQSSYQQTSQKYRAAMHQPYEDSKADTEDPFITPEVKTPASAKEIFQQIGNTLRQQRESLSLSLEDVENQPCYANIT
jgi:cytoskeletal protein RodZ